PDHLHCFVSIHLRHHHVHQDDGDVRSGIQRGDGFTTGAGGEHRKSSPLQNAAESEDVAHIVVHHQDLFAHQRIVGMVQPVEHLLFLGRKIGDYAVQEKRRLVQQTFGGFYSLYHHAARQLVQPRILVRRQLLAGEDYHRKVAQLGHLTEALQHFEARHIGQTKVEHHAIIRFIVENLERFLAAGRYADFDVVVVEQLFYAELFSRIVFHHQQSFLPRRGVI